MSTDPRAPLPYVHVAEVLVTEPGTGRILLVRSQGKWWLPGGMVEKGETFVEAALREVAEETGVTVEFQGVGWRGSSTGR